METTASREWRAQIRASVHYLRTIRPIVQRIAAEHAAWARFVGTAVSPTGTMPPREQAVGASRFAITFAGLRGRLQRAVPTAACETLHVNALAWVEALDLLAAALPPAVESGSLYELRAIGREASEALSRLKVFQRSHAATVVMLKQMFAARPRAARRLRRAPVAPIVKAAPTALDLPPWRRPRPVVRRAVGF